MLLGSKKKARRAQFEHMLRMGVPRHIVVTQAAAEGIDMKAVDPAKLKRPPLMSLSVTVYALN